MKITLFYIPVGSESEARDLGQAAVEECLAACANIFPIQSLYPWEGQMQQDPEFVLILKTIPDLCRHLEGFIQEKHSYKVPCILHWDVAVSEAYGRWVSDTVMKT